MKALTHALRTRRVVQALFACICLAGGAQFYAYLQWTADRWPWAVPRPPVVEGFLPIAALMALKRLADTAVFDPVHPAGLAIFLAALALAFLLRRGFCGHVCPVGLLSEALGGLGRRLGLGFSPRGWADRVLRGLKYLLLAPFLSLTLTMDPAALQAFGSSSYAITADARMLEFYLSPSASALGWLGLLVILGLVLRNAWCRYLCPYGALLGLCALPGPTAVRRDAHLCVDCKACDARCPAGIGVSVRSSTRGLECIGCGDCVRACGAKALAPRCFGLPVPLGSLALGAVCLMLGAWLVALASGHWYSALPGHVLKALYGGMLGR